jgi:internalin A
MGLHGSLIHILLAESKEIRLLKLAVHLKAQAARLLHGLGGIEGDDFQELIHAGWVDFENHNNIDHGSCDKADFAITCNLPLSYLSFRPRFSQDMKFYLHLPILLSASVLFGQEAKPAAPATPAPEPAKPAPAAPEVKPEPAKAPPAPAPEAKPAPAKPTPAPETKPEVKPAPEPPPPPPKPESFFKDKALEAAVRRQVYAKRENQEVLTAEDVSTVSIIEAKGAGITDLTGLEKCKALASLTLTENKITSLAAIAGLERLQFLDVANNQVSDISPLASCTALQYVELTNNKVADVSHLGGIAALTSLYLAGNQITDISALFKLPKVWTLYLDSNKVTSLEGIGALKWLSMLSLKDNQVSDLSPLEPLTELQFLFLDKNPVTDLTPLHRMWMKDNDSAREWAPYCQIFISACPLNEASKAMVAEMKKAGARISP